MKVVFKNIKEYAVRFLFTQRCKYCGRVIDIRKESCDSCENSIKEITGAICFKCGKEKKKCDFLQFVHPKWAKSYIMTVSQRKGDLFYGNFCFGCGG